MRRYRQSHSRRPAMLSRRVHDCCFAMILSCLLAPVASAGDWKVTIDQLCGHEQSIRISIAADGTEVASVKEAREKTFRELSRTRISTTDAQSIHDKTVALQQLLKQSNPTTKSPADSDLRYRLIVEQDGMTTETRWVAGQLKHQPEAAQQYRALLVLVNAEAGLSVKLKPDPFEK